MAVYYNEIKKTFIESDLPIEVLEENGYMPIWGAKLKLSSDAILKSLMHELKLFNVLK